MKNETAASSGFVPSGIDTETKILGAAAELFAARGFRGSAIRDIANAARINEVTIYRYFHGKQDLCWRAVDWKMRQASVAEILVQPLTKIGPPRQQLGEFCAAALELLTQEPTLARLLYFTGLEMDASERKIIFSNHMKPVITALLVRLRAWMATGEIRPVDPETAAIGILGVLLSRAQLHELIGPVFAPHKSIQELSSEYTELCLRGLQ